MGQLKIFFVFLLVACLPLVSKSQVTVLEQSVTISFRHDSLTAALLRLQAKSKINFAFDPAIIPAEVYISKRFNNVPLKEVLDQLLTGQKLTYSLINTDVVIVKKQLTFTIDGHLQDSDSGEELIGASIYIPELKTGVLSNQYGFYSLTLPEGNYTFVVSHLGYQVKEQQVQLTKDQTLVFSLSPRLNTLNEVVVGSSPADSGINRALVSNMRMEEFKSLPYYGGEVDVIKALQMQNGIKSMTEGSSGLFVRGGNIDQNLIMLDEAMIYNPSHLFGLVSVFNQDAIKNVQIYNDYIPANFGGRLSSVIDSRMAEGNNREFHLKGGASLLSVRLAAEGPLVQEKGSFLLTFRRSLLDLVNQNFKLVNPNSTYYDLNIKSNYQINRNNRLFCSFYYGDDHLFSRNSYINTWGNMTSTLRLNHIFSSRLFFNLSAIYSDYKNVLDVNADTISEKYRWQTGIKDLSIKGDFIFYKSPQNEIKFGAHATMHRFIPGETINGFPEEFNIPRDRAGEYALYFSHQYAISRRLKINYGLRASLLKNAENRPDAYDSEGNQLNLKDRSVYRGLEPRVNLIALLRGNQRLHATYNRTIQYLQLVQNSELAFSSLETWMPASDLTKAQHADYFSAGYSYQPENYSVTVSLYGKNLYNQVDLIDHAQVIQNPEIRKQLRSGTSNAYGAELTLVKSSGLFTGSLAYSWSRAFRKIADINNNNRFVANYDIPHDLKVSLAYKLTEKLSFSSFFTYSSGRPITLPVGYYVHDGTQVPIYEGRNTSRFPDFNRLDFTARYSTGRKENVRRSFSSTVSAGIYNVYNRKNPLIYRLSQASASNSLSLVESATGILPWVAYSFNF